MKVSINKIKPEKYPENEVLSHEWKMPYRSAAVVMHPDGLFSDEIFGRLEHCECGLLKKPGFCKKCQKRVVDINNLPDYWFDMGLKILGFMPDWNGLELDKTRTLNIEQVLEYTHFVYISKFTNDDGEEDFNISVEEMPEINEEFDIDKFNQEDIYIGEEGALLLGATQEWLDENMTDTLLIPHPNYRPLIRNNDNKPIITEINQHYQDIIIRCNNIKELLKFSHTKMHLLVSKYKVSQIYKKIIEGLQDVLQGSRYSVVRSEIIAHPLSGAIRGILLNRHDLHEDVILVGDQFIESTYPFLYKKHSGDMVKINREFIENDYVGLLNRPPSISYFSTMGMRPRVASLYPREFMGNSNGGLLENTEYIESGLYTPNNYYLQGDVEGISPQYIGRKNYDSVPKQKNYNVKKTQSPKNIKVMVKDPYGINYPQDNLTPLKRDRNSTPLEKEEKTKLDLRDANYNKQEPIEEFLYKHGYSNENSFIKIDELMDEVYKLSHEEYINVTDLSVREITDKIDHLVLNKEFLNSGMDKVLDLDKDEAIRTLAIALIESKNLNYKTLMARQDIAKVSYGLKKRDITQIIKNSLAGLDIFHRYIALRLDLVSKANLLLTEDNRRSYDYITEAFLNKTVNAINGNGFSLENNPKDFKNSLSEKILDQLNSCESYNQQKTNYSIMTNSAVEDEDGNLKFTISEEEIQEKRKNLLLETSKHLSELYCIEYVRLQRMLLNLNIKVRKDLNSDFKPILEVVKENSFKLIDQREKSEVEIFKIKKQIDEKEELLEDLNAFYDKIEDESLISDIETHGVDTSKYKNIKQVKAEIQEVEDEITSLNEDINEIINSVESVKDINIEDLYTINGKLNGVKTIEHTNISGKVFKVAADGIVVENIRGLSINPITCDGQASDFDGDVLLYSALYGRNSMKEAEFMLSSQRFINYADGTIRNSIVEDFFYGYKEEA